MSQSTQYNQSKNNANRRNVYQDTDQELGITENTGIIPR